MSEKPTTVLTISRQLGSGGSFIGQAVARQLDLKYLDREILQQAAAQLGFGEGELAANEERAASFWDALFRAFATGPPEVMYTGPTQPPLYEEDVFRVESEIMRELAHRFDAVVVGRAGFRVLADHPGLVSVSLHAKKAWRVSRLMEVHGIADEASALAMVESSDRHRSEFIHTFTGLSWNDATHFDLCLDTSTVGLEVATEIVTTLVRARMHRAGAGSGERALPAG